MAPKMSTGGTRAAGTTSAWFRGHVTRLAPTCGEPDPREDVDEQEARVDVRVGSPGGLDQVEVDRLGRTDECQRRSSEACTGQLKLTVTINALLRSRPRRTSQTLQGVQ